MSLRQNKLPIEALERIDDLCALFERHWQSGDPVSPESLVAAEADPLQRQALLGELILLDVDYRRRRGEQPQQQEYRERFSDDHTIVQAAFQEVERKAGSFAPPSPETLNKLFPRLEVLELVGAGGMGAVYKVRQTGLDRIVALKILPPELGHDVRFALRFTREARTLARLTHPNIVSLYEFGQAEDTYYFLMEFVTGTTLRNVVVSRELPTDQALVIVPQLCDALQYAHDQGVIHRDIKPENILLSSDGAVKIADFGLSRLLTGDTPQPSLTASHQVLGTPRYMAPEQLEGRQDVDHRADIYSLGVVIYEMLTGELPIGRFAAPSEKVQIDVRLDEVVLRTLEKEPQRRYQRAVEIKSDVQSITSTDPAYAKTRIGQLAPADRDTDPNPDTDPGHNGEPAFSSTRNTAALQQQEVAARYLLTRQQLMDRVRGTLRPLRRGQILQIFVGIGLIAMGAQCWARHTDDTARLICGLIIHVYGVVVIGTAANVCTKIARVDYSEPVVSIRQRVDRIRTAYLRTGIVVGLVWWLMWIPAAVSLGFDAVLFPQSLVISLAVGLPGLIITWWLHRRGIRSEQPWAKKLAGESIASTYRILDEIEQASVR